jgi:hypothetical protein
VILDVLLFFIAGESVEFVARFAIALGLLFPCCSSIVGELGEDER